MRQRYNLNKPEPNRDEAEILDFVVSVRLSSRRRLNQTIYDLEFSQSQTACDRWRVTFYSSLVTCHLSPVLSNTLRFALPQFHTLTPCKFFKHSLFKVRKIYSIDQEICSQFFIKILTASYLKLFSKRLTSPEYAVIR